MKSLPLSVERPLTGNNLLLYVKPGILEGFLRNEESPKPLKFSLTEKKAAQEGVFLTPPKK
jgi:hypothetical protein